jgi:hypothetical protein
MPAGVAIVDEYGREFVSTGNVVLCCHSGELFVRDLVAEDN